jgi:hypothetical protein
MAVTKQNYTQAATWTASQLANLFQSAFTDAGLMTAWYDSFLSGSVENRILEIQYDNTKTYGKTYYWFMFTTGGVFTHIASGWNATTHVPTGTQYLDYYSTTTNATTNHNPWLALSTATAVTVSRYSSGARSGYSWFLVTNGSTSGNVHIPRASVPLPAWIDLNKVLFHAYTTCVNIGNAQWPNVSFRDLGSCLRRSFHVGSALNGNTTNPSAYAGAIPGNSTGTSPLSGNYDGVSAPALSYICLANASSNSAVGANWRGSPATGNSIILPTGFNSSNPAFTTDYIPVYSELLYNPYVSEAMPSDFGVTFHFANNTMAFYDKLIVSSGSEEWEMLLAANTNTVTTNGSALFMARTT